MYVYGSNVVVPGLENILIALSKTIRSVIETFCGAATNTHYATSATPSFSSVPYLFHHGVAILTNTAVVAKLRRNNTKDKFLACDSREKWLLNDTALLRSPRTTNKVSYVSIIRSFRTTCCANIIV